MTVTINAATVASLQVYSTPPLHIADTCTIVSWSRRSTKQNPIEAVERYRGIVIDRAAIAIAPDACASKFQRLLSATVASLADGMFQAWATENMHATQYDGAAITTDSALAFWAEKKQREVIDGAAILAWLEASETYKALPTDAVRAVWKNKLPKIAAPSYKGSFTQAEANKIIARFAEEDADTSTGLFIMQRLSNIIGEQSQEDAL